MQRITRPDPVSAAALRRIGLALLLSAALHLLLVVRLESGSSAGGNLQGTIQARLDLQPSPASVRSPRIRTPFVRKLPDDRTAGDAVTPPRSEQPAAGIDEQVQSSQQPVGESIRVPVDPVYYAARELDVYPVPIERLQAPSGAVNGWVRVLALVDETGAVTRADVFDSDAAGVAEETALQAVRTARFSPARKEGRAVRSRILIELRFGEGEE